MSRSGTLLGTGLLIVVTAFHAGCSGNGVGIGILTGSNPSPENTSPPGAFPPDLTSRPEQVAFISACALAYRFAHDPVKLRAAYLSYEAKRAVSREQLPAIEKGYDTTYQAIDALDSSRKSNYCATKDGEEVKSELRRYTSGFFDARTPPPAAASGDADCGGKCRWVDR